MESANEYKSKIWKLAVSGENEKGLQLCSKLLKIRNVSGDYNIQGVLFYNLKQYEEAIKSYDMALQLDAENIYALCNKAHVYYDIGEKEQAFKFYSKSLDFDTNFAHGHAGRGKIFHDKGSFQESLECYNKAIEHVTDNPLFFCNRAKVFKDLGEYDLALKDFRKASSLIEKGLFGDLASGIVSYIKTTLKDLMILQKIIDDNQKILQTFDQNHPTLKLEEEQFKALAKVGKMITDKVIDGLDTSSKQVSQKEQTEKDKILALIQQDPQKVFEILQKYPQAYQYSEIMPYLIKLNMELQQKLENARSKAVIYQCSTAK